MTAEELLKLPDDGLRHELIRGELTSMTPSGSNHSRATSSICEILGPHIRDHDLGWRFGAEGGFIIATDPDTVLAPDFAFVSNARIPKGPPPDGFFPGAPDLAVEVLSPHDRMVAVNFKIKQWLDAGTRQVWIVDLNLTTITIHAKGRQPQVFTATDIIEAADLLPGFRITVEKLLPPI